MNAFIRAALIVALGLGRNLLCADAWTDAPSFPPSKVIGPGKAVATIESIWSTY